MAIQEYLVGNDLSIVRTFDQKLILRDSAGNTVDCSASFDEEDVIFSLNKTVILHDIPGRVATFIPGGGQRKPIVFEFRVPIYTYDGELVENSFRQIENLFDNSVGGLVDIFWVYDTVNENYAYLASCLWSDMREVRRTNREQGQESYAVITVVSLAKQWTKSFPGDSDPVAVVARGPWRYTATTNDGSPGMVAVRESDLQTLLELTDQGDLYVYGVIKEAQDLSAYDIDLEDY